MFFLLNIFNKVIDVFLIVLFVRVVISWIAPGSRNEFTELVYKITDPVLERCKIIIPVGRGYMDLSPIVVYFLARLAQRVLTFLVYRLSF
ncbi:MAG: YggT family protein [Fusobacteriaceae bacterium]